MQLLQNVAIKAGVKKRHASTFGYLKMYENGEGGGRGVSTELQGT